MLSLNILTAGSQAPEICGPCGGECCKRMPGAYHPDEFGSGLEAVKELLASGLAAIDWWDGFGGDDYARGYYLRPAVVDGCKVFDPSWGGPCVRLTPEGCSLKFDERPFVCRMLVAKKNRMCQLPEEFFSSSQERSDKWHMAKAWEPYHADLERIGREVQQGK